MQEFKFKCWNKSEKKFEEVDHKSFIIYQDRLFRENESPTATIQVVNAPRDSMVFCMSTLKKDNNGVEIFHGSIVLTSGGIGAVIFSRDIMGFEVVLQCGSRCLFGFLSEEVGVRVKGNIFQNLNMLPKVLRDKYEKLNN